MNHIHPDWDPLTEMDEKEKAAFDEVKAAVAEKLNPELMQDDYWIWRFLKAREFDAKASTEMIEKHLAWRVEKQLDTIVERWEANPQKEFLDQYCPMQFHGVDKRGCPIYIERFGMMDFAGLMHSIKEEDLANHHYYQLEKGERLKHELFKQTGKRIVKHLVIEDMSGLGWAHFHAQFLAMGKRIIAYDEDAYPEIAGKLYVINAPWIFNALWKVVRACLTERTVAKVAIMGTEYMEELQKEIDIEQIPAEFGGKCTEHNGKCLSDGGAVPEKFHKYKHLAGEEPGDGEEIQTVKSGAKHEHAVHVKKAGVAVAYEFWTTAYDIGFEVVYSPPEMPSKRQGLILSKRYDNSADEHAHGTFDTIAPGTYTLIWDNSYSMFRSKEVHYHVRVSDPDADEDLQEEIEKEKASGVPDHVE